VVDIVSNSHVVDIVSTNLIPVKFLLKSSKFLQSPQSYGICPLRGQIDPTLNLSLPILLHPGHKYLHPSDFAPQTLNLLLGLTEALTLVFRVGWR
jgi:hypothetical protein